MTSEEIQNVALAYTIKTSAARTPEEFLIDYERYKNEFQKIEDSKPIPKAGIHKRSDFGL